MAPSSDEARRKMRELSPRGPRRCAQTLRRRRRSPRSASWRSSACPGTEIASSTPLRRKTGRRVVGKSCAPSWSTSWSARPATRTASKRFGEKRPSTCGGPRPSAGAEPWQSRPTPCFGGGESSCTSKSRAPTPQRSGATPTRLSTPTRRSFTSSTTAWATTTPWSKSSSLTRWPRRGRSRRRRFASLLLAGYSCPLCQRPRVWAGLLLNPLGAERFDLASREKSARHRQSVASSPARLPSFRLCHAFRHFARRTGRRLLAPPRIRPAAPAAGR